MNIKRPEIKLRNIQIKSLEAAQRLAVAMLEIEEQCGIHETILTLENPFVCPWIDLGQLNKTPMEKSLRQVLAKIGY